MLLVTALLLAAAAPAPLDPAVEDALAEAELYRTPAGEWRARCGAIPPPRIERPDLDGDGRADLLVQSVSCDGAPGDFALARDEGGKLRQLLWRSGEGHLLPHRTNGLPDVEIDTGVPCRALWRYGKFGAYGNSENCAKP